MINLGTNDVGSGISGEQFQETYTQFLRDIRAKYPDAALFAMETFKQRYVAETQAAVQTVQDEGDDNVHFINTEGWLTPDEDFTDGDGHPNDQGHRKVAQRLAEVLAPVLGVAKS